MRKISNRNLDFQIIQNFAKDGMSAIQSKSFSITGMTCQEKLLMHHRSNLLKYHWTKLGGTTLCVLVNNLYNLVNMNIKKTLNFVWPMIFQCFCGSKSVKGFNIFIQQFLEIFKIWFNWLKINWSWLFIFCK